MAHKLVSSSRNIWGSWRHSWTQSSRRTKGRAGLGLLLPCPQAFLSLVLCGFGPHGWFELSPAPVSSWMYPHWPGKTPLQLVSPHLLKPAPFPYFSACESPPHPSGRYWKGKGPRAKPAPECLCQRPGSRGRKTKQTCNPVAKGGRAIPQAASVPCSGILWWQRLHSGLQ